MRSLKGSVLAAVTVVLLLAVAAPVALATTWDIKKPLNIPAGKMTSGGKTFTVTNKSGATVGKVVKTKSGGWKVFRGSKQVAVAKANGSKKYPVNLYDMKGIRIGRCGLRDGAWSMVRFSGVLRIIVGVAPKDCPARAAMGAARILVWK